MAKKDEAGVTIVDPKLPEPSPAPPVKAPVTTLSEVVRESAFRKINQACDLSDAADHLQKLTNLGAKGIHARRKAIRIKALAMLDEGLVVLGL